MTGIDRIPWAALTDLVPETARPGCWEPCASGLTASGTPVEASLSATNTEGRLQRRVVVDPGAGRSPEARVAAGLAAARAVGQVLKRPGRAVAEDLVAALTACPPDEPEPWAIWVGVATAAGQPVAVKVYARLTDRSALDHVASRAGAPTKALGRVLATLPHDLPADWCFAGWNVALDGSVAAKVYLRARPGEEHTVLSWVVRPCGVEIGAVLDALSDSGLSRALWTGGMILAVGWSEKGSKLGVHASPPVDQPDRWRLARALGARVTNWHGALDELAGTAGTNVDVSWFGLGFVPPGDVAQLTVYLAPR